PVKAVDIPLRNKRRFLSVCSGIEAVSVAWDPLDFEPVAYSEIEPFPSAVLAHHYPDVPNLGDMTQYANWTLPSIDLLAGGTPCQSFSVAGKRGSLNDDRGNLCLTFYEIADKFDPEWILWENVPGVVYVIQGEIANGRRQQQNGMGITENTSYTLTASTVHGISARGFVRRLMPVECERLQGFPDDWTRVEKKPGTDYSDSYRYKAIGNSMAVPVIRWIGQQILKATAHA
ncbi:DNA cytosine methyltransferase, partial [Akkermansia sp.]